MGAGLSNRDADPVAGTASGVLVKPWRVRQRKAVHASVSRAGGGQLNKLFRTVRGNRGVEIAEFALALPLFLIIMISIVDFGIYSFIQHTLQFATREGVRLALVGRTLTDASGNTLTREAS